MNSLFPLLLFLAAPAAPAGSSDDLGSKFLFAFLGALAALALKWLYDLVHYFVTRPYLTAHFYDDKPGYRAIGVLSWTDENECDHSRDELYINISVTNDG